MAAVNTLFARKIRPFTYNVSFNGELCTLHQLDVFHSNALKRFHGLSNSSGLQHNHIIKLSWRCVHTIAKTFSKHILSAFIDSPTHLTFSTTVELNPHGNVWVPSPWMNPDDVGFDPGVQTMLDNTALISVSCEILRTYSSNKNFIQIKLTVNCYDWLWRVPKLKEPL